MSSFLSHSLESSCGDSRWVSGLFNVLQCTDTVESHLSLIHLLKESVAEGELILARAGLFDVQDSVMAKMLVCAKHRHTYGNFWRQRSACQYPTHPGSNSKGAKAISKMYVVLVHVGSGRNKWFKISGWFQPISPVFSPIARSYINPLFPTSSYFYQLPQQAQCSCAKKKAWVSLESTEKEASDSCVYVR